MLLKPGHCQVCLTACGPEGAPTIICNVGTGVTSDYCSAEKAAVTMTHFHLVENGHIIQGPRFGGCVRFSEISDREANQACSAFNTRMSIPGFHLPSVNFNQQRCAWQN